METARSHFYSARQGAPSGCTGRAAKMRQERE
jgi:hypothetical protein